MEADLYEYDTSELKKEVVAENETFSAELLLLLVLLLAKPFSPKTLTDYVARVENTSSRSLQAIEERLSRELPFIAKNGMLAGKISSGRLQAPRTPRETRKLLEDITLSNDHYDVLDTLFEQSMSGLRTHHNGMIKQFEQEAKLLMIRHRREKSAAERGSVKAPLQTGMDPSVAFIDKAGKKWSITRFSQSTMNTLVRSVFQESLIQFTVENKLRFGQITSNPTTTDKCLNWQNKYVKFFDSDPAPLPSYNELKASGEIWHPNCVHFLVPVDIDLSSIL
jgi:hypothetical protein